MMIFSQGKYRNIIHIYCLALTKVNRTSYSQQKIMDLKNFTFDIYLEDVKFTNEVILKMRRIY